MGTDNKAVRSVHALLATELTEAELDQVSGATGISGGTPHRTIGQGGSGSDDDAGGDLN